VKKAVFAVALVLVLLGTLVPVCFAKTHKDVYNVSCDGLWPAVKDAVRNSGKYGIVGIDNNEMSISYVIGGTLGGKRINSVVLNRLSDKSCEMQTQTAYSGLIHNDAADFKERVDASVAKLQSAGGKPAAATAQKDEATLPAPSSAAVSTASSEPPSDLKKGMTPSEVEKITGKPKDSISLKESLVYIYPAYKVIFEKGQLVEVQVPDAVGK
jgi:hypothetical protein